MLGTGIGLTTGPTIDAHIDPNAFVARTPPPGFDAWLPVRPEVVTAPGNVTLDRSLKEAFLAAYPEVTGGAVAYVATGGSNSTAVVGDPARPFATITAALQADCRIVEIAPGVYAPPQYRYTYSPQAGGAKLLRAAIPQTVTLREPCVDLTTSDWSQHAGDIWKTTVPLAAGNASATAYAPHHIRLIDEFDDAGFEARLRRFGGIIGSDTDRDAALAELGAAGRGWVYDGRQAQKLLYVALDGANVSFDRTRLRAVANGGTAPSKLFIYGATIALEGLVLDGLVSWALSHKSPDTDYPSSIWAWGCTLFNSPGYAFEGSGGARCFAENCRLHANDRDGINLDNRRSALKATPYGLMAGCTVDETGDTATNGLQQALDKQAASSHGGYIATFGCNFATSWGSEVADTATDSTNRSWHVGLRLGPPADGISPTTSGLSFSGARTAWLDTCWARHGRQSSLALQGGASAFVSGCSFAEPAVIGGGSTAPVPYTPSAP